MQVEESSSDSQAGKHESKTQAGKPAPQAQAGKPALQVFYRRRLPHWQPDGAIIFLTWRLVGSLPKETIERLREERSRLMALPARPNESPRDRALREGKALFAMADEALSEAVRAGIGPLWLGDPRVAEMVRAAFYFWDGTRYALHRYVIMANHVHVLLEPLVVRQAGEVGPRVTQAVKFS